MSENRAWTAEQRQGIELTGSSLLLSAAAGSGKTAVLAERCAHLVCDASEPCNVDELLVVTFTEAAAGEMRQRIGQAIRSRIAAKNDPRLKRQTALIERATVGTLHSFCSRILHQHFNVLGIDPGFIMLDEEDAKLMRVEIARDLVHAAYEGDMARDIAALVDAYGDGDDENIVKRVLELHELMCSLVDPEKWMNTAVDRIAKAADGRLEKSELGRALITDIANRIDATARRCAAAIAQISAYRSFPKYVDELAAIEQTLAVWRKTLASSGLDATAALVAQYRNSAARAPSYANNLPNKNEAKAAYDSVREELKKGALGAALRFSATQWQDGCRATLGHAEVLLRLVQMFGDRYASEKSAARAMDFADLERFALKALRKPDGSPSAVAAYYHRQYRHVLVDEYQDINEVQDAILALLSHECLSHSAGNLFTVGDVKQSIYRFRLAVPMRFLQRSEKFRGNAGSGKVIDLRANFRSRGPILNAVNAFFERVMTADAVDIEYDDTHRLVPGTQYPPTNLNAFAGGPVEVHLLPQEGPIATTEDDDADDSDRTDREAWLIARRIESLMAEGKAVFDKDAKTCRALKYGDIAILVRTAAVKAQQIAGVLREFNIPVHAEGRSGFFEAIEVRDILSLLEVLDNQRQDIPLAAFFRSPLAALAAAEDAMARVRLAYPDDAFCDALIRYAREKTDGLSAHLRDLLAALDRWRTLARRRPLAEVLWTIYEETGYLAFVSGLPGGEQRKANLLLLHARSGQFGTFQKQGLGRFMTFIRSLEEESDLGQASVASDADDVVKILSIHKSKGLEFPLVIVPDLGKRINLSDARGPILADRREYLGLSVVDDVKKIRYPSLAHHLIRQRLTQQTLAEELRVLYVAMTRAREHLILIGTCAEVKLDEWRRVGARPGKLNTDTILSAQTMLDWLMAGIAILAKHYHVERHTAEQVAEWASQADRVRKSDERLEKLARLEPFAPPPPADAAANEVIARLEYVYPHRAATQRPAVASVTGLAKERDAEIPAVPFPISTITTEATRLSLPRCCDSTAAAEGTDIGTATHLVLQYFDFSAASAIEDQINRLVDRKMLTGQQAALVDRAAIEWFLTTDLAQLLRREPAAIHRELPIYFSLPTEGETGLDQTMVRGRLDLMIAPKEQVILADYKTDRISPATLNDRAKFYAPQLHLYRDAIEKILNRRVNKMSLVFLHLRQIVGV